MDKLNFHYIDVLLDQLYGMEMEPEDIEEQGLLAYELLGNKTTKLYKYSACPNLENYIELPCDAVEIEAVTTSYEDWKRDTNDTIFGDQNSSFTENYIEGHKVYTHPFYISGKLIPYEQVGRKLYFTRNYGQINVLFKAHILDAEGLPELTDKEARAIATYIAYTAKFKEGLITNNGNIISLANVLEQKWNKYCDQARVTSLSQNEMNEILNVANSYDRHTYGYSYKPLKK